ncbi:MAG: ATP synthase F0 subunit B [Deltaproteobacteria bacterium]|nr:ATP synthase F0 subunit B [Deltaproteobacteria bacterium]
MISLNITLLIQIAIFLTLMILLNQILFKPMVRVLENRKAWTEGRRKAAAEAAGEAEAIWAEYQKRLQEARADADRVKSELIRQGDAERQRVVDAAAAQAEKTVAEVRAQVRAEVLEARKILEVEARALATTAAQAILGRSV